MTYWFPGSPVWLWSIGFAFTLVYVNARSVSDFGTFEYWFALIKVVAIVLFIILGSASIFGIGLEPVGFHNLTGLPGGFMPHGLGGMWMAVIMGVFAFNGVEVIAVTAGEVRHPETAIPAALRNMVVRLFLFYVLALGIVVTFVPWTATGARVVAESPFVSVLGYAGLSHAAGIMNFVVLSAALSSMNVNVYLSSRMLFSLSRGGYAPAFLGRLGPNRAPRAAILISGRRHPLRRCDRESNPAGLQLPVRRRPVRRHGRLDLHPAESPELPASPRCRRSAGAHAVLSIPAARRARPARRGAGHHGTRYRVLEHLVDRRCSVVAAGFRGVLRLAHAAAARHHDRKCGMTLLPSSSIATCGSGPSGTAETDFVQSVGLQLLDSGDDLVGRADDAESEHLVGDQALGSDIVAAIDAGLDRRKVRTLQPDRRESLVLEIRTKIRHHVPHLVGGGLAISRQRQPRATGDHERISRTARPCQAALDGGHDV
jgi:hypothetical protein